MRDARRPARHREASAEADGGGRVAQSFRAASIGRAKALHYRFNKDVLHDKNENYFMPPVITNTQINDLTKSGVIIR